ncbi:MAG: MBL fold metallo-hydrolase [Bacteroidota bacterium]
MKSERPFDNFLSLMIPAFQSHGSLLSDIQAMQQQTDGFHLWWLGQSGFLIQWQGKHLLFDPYLSDSLTKKYADTDKPHIRMSELVISPEKLDFIDLVTSTHNHTDHLDGETLIPLMQINPGLTLIIPEANRQFVANRIGADVDYPIGLTAGGSFEAHGIRLTAIPAAHEELEVDESGCNKCVGYVAEFGPWCVYHSGDTMLYDGMLDYLNPFSIDLALLPINGRDPARRVAGNLNSEQAVWLGKQLGISCIIPCHYDMFTFNTADPNEFIQIAERERQGYAVLKIGERRSFIKASRTEIPLP